jgi:uncharacterized protein YjbI with pentapeptide repeats
LVNLSQVILDEADLREVNLSKALLYKTSLRKAQLQRANLHQNDKPSDINQYLLDSKNNLLIL